MDPGRDTVRCAARGNVRKRESGVAVGDRVRVSRAPGGQDGVLEEVLPRMTYLTRPQVANVDQAVVVMSVAQPEPNLHLLDRVLVLVEHSRLDAVVCFTKADLACPGEGERLADSYSRVGYRAILTSARARLGIPKLAAALAGKTSVFAGPSGAGKSALLNAVQPGHNLAEGELSTRIGRGRHTTREVRLIPLDVGGTVADTPGFSVLDIESINSRELAMAFREMREHALGCRFAGCVHDAEPECAVKQAVREGKIEQGRYERYLTFLGELREAEKKQYK
jgi:ribosome biogenesis GTPase